MKLVSPWSNPLNIINEILSMFDVYKLYCNYLQMQINTILPINHKMHVAHCCDCKELLFPEYRICHTK